MTPLEWAVLPLRRYADFSGRAPRAEYWWFNLGTVVVQIPLNIADKMLGSWTPLSTLFSLATLLPWIAVTVRRLHDTNRSGLWLLLFIGVFAVIGFMAVAIGISNYSGGTASGFTALMIAILLVLASFVTFLVFMVLPGTQGANDYGPDPYGRNDLEEVFA